MVLEFGSVVIGDAGVNYVMDECNDLTNSAINVNLIAALTFDVLETQYNPFGECA